MVHGDERNDICENTERGAWRSATRKERRDGFEIRAWVWADGGGQVGSVADPSRPQTPPPGPPMDRKPTADPRRHQPEPPADCVQRLAEGRAGLQQMQNRLGLSASAGDLPKMLATFAGRHRPRPAAKPRLRWLALEAQGCLQTDRRPKTAEGQSLGTAREGGLGGTQPQWPGDPTLNIFRNTEPMPPRATIPKAWRQP